MNKGASGSVELEKERGSLVDILYRDPLGPWGLYVFRREDGTTFSAAGDFGNAILYEDFLLRGRYNPPVPGGDFEVSSFNSMPPTAVQSLPGYLTALTKVARSATNTLVKFFGADTIAILDRSPERLCEAGISSKDAEKLGSIWAEQRAQHLALAQIDIAGIPEERLSELQRILGFSEDINARLRKDPYLLYCHFDDILFGAAKSLAARFGVPNDSVPAVKAAVVATLRKDCFIGNSYIEGGPLISSVMSLLGLPREVVRSLIGTAVTELTLNGVLKTSESRLQLAKVQQAESGLVDTVVTWSMLSPEDCPDIAPSPQMGLKLLAPMKLGSGEKQLAAGIVALLESRFALVQCETYEDEATICRGLQLTLMAFGVEVVFAAYTGEMVKDLRSRLGDTANVVSYGTLVGLDPSTGVPTRHSNNPIGAELLIICGADAFGIEELDRSINSCPMTGRVFLLGLPKDLPSSSVGQPFEELFAVPKVQTFQASFWLPARSDRRMVANQLWAGRLQRNATGFDPSAPISWLEADRNLIPEALPALIQAFTSQTHTNPVLDVKVVMPAPRGAESTGEISTWLTASLAKAFTGSDAAVEFQGKSLFPGMPIIIKQVVAREHLPEMSVYIAKSVSREQVEAESIDGLTTTLTLRQRLDIFNGTVVLPKFIKGRVYEMVVLVALKEHHHLINSELLASLMNNTRTTLVVMGELDGLEIGFQDRKSSRCRSRIPEWIASHVN